MKSRYYNFNSNHMKNGVLEYFNRFRDEQREFEEGDEIDGRCTIIDELDKDIIEREISRDDMRDEIACMSTRPLIGGRN